MKKLIPILALIYVLVPFHSTVQAQEIISGVVTDPSQTPIAWAVIRAVPGNTTAGTNQQGLFEIKLPVKASTIEISHFSYEKKVIRIKHLVQLRSKDKTGKKILHIVLQPAAPANSEQVVVTGHSFPGAPHPLVGAAPGMTSRKNIRRLYYSGQAYPTATESYAHEAENKFKNVSSAPLSTFSIDVDKASYSNIRRFITKGQLPPKDAVRTEELINYFDYQYAQPEGHAPVTIYTYMGRAPWNQSHQLIQVGVQGKRIAATNLPATNLVFLIDVSGSMNAMHKLPLLITGFKMLTDQLRAQDRVAIVTYAGSSRTVLPATSGSKKEKIKAALDGLTASGSTNGAGGIEMAYQIAEKHFKEKGNNRVILASDGDFNVGPSSLADLEKLIIEKRKSGIYLSVLGFGMGNYKDDKMEQLADKGNGNYAYIDNSMEAQRVLLKEFGGTLFTIANDVKIQVEFNPALVAAYRLIGYENRSLAAEDFNQDTVDAAEIGSGQSVTALYEIIPAGAHDQWTPELDPLKYQTKKCFTTTGNNLNENELATIKLRYKRPGQSKSRLISHVVKTDSGQYVTGHSQLQQENFQFAAAVAGFGMLLSGSDYVQDLNYDQLISRARKAKGEDERGDRAGFIQLAEAAQALQGNQAKVKSSPTHYHPGPRPIFKRPLPLHHKAVE